MLGAVQGPRRVLDSYGNNEKSQIKGKVLFRLFQFVAPYKTKLSIAIFLMLISTATALFIPFQTKFIIDQYIAQSDYNGLYFQGLILLGVIIINFLSSFSQRGILSKIGQRVLSSLRLKLFSHLQKLGVAYNDRNIIGVTISRLTSDVSVINNLLTEGFVQIIGDSILILGTIFLMIILNAPLALFSFLILPILILAMKIFSDHARDAFKETRKTLGHVIGDFAENLSGIRVTKAFNREKVKQSQFREKNHQNKIANINAMTLSFLFLPIVELLQVIATCIVIGVGSFFVFQGNVTIGIIAAFMTYLSRLFAPIQQLSLLFATLQSASAGGERILELLDLKSNVSDPDKPLDIPMLKGKLEFRNVNFAYHRKTPILRDLSFSIDPGKTLAIVGATGSGKSTIVNLILRYYEYHNDFNTGSILLDGYELRELDSKFIHSKMGYVAQDPFLFPISIKDNIAFGNSQSNLSRVRKIARIIGIDKMIENLPEAYDTPISEGAVNFSIGQRQLIAIARALYIDPKILIMDEATSSVDTVTEALLQRALKELVKNRTSIIIAHRLTTIKNADQIIVLDKGKIIESGTHEELMEKKSYYHSLYIKQFIKF